jgi:DNA-binding protein HU-beta
MNKADLVLAVADKAEVSRRDAEAVIEGAIDIIVGKLIAGEAIKLSGFGNFEKKTRAARTGTNPTDGTKINIPARKTIVFKPSKTLKEKLQ